ISYQLSAISYQLSAISYQPSDRLSPSTQNLGPRAYNSNLSTNSTTIKATFVLFITDQVQTMFDLQITMKNVCLFAWKVTV
uniref:hypothetical protein n=1 Tax=uncultured Pseudoalteromonas sp. TaxID=114053 RepID=UPI0032B23D1C